jgi:hypothetical protein
MLGRETLLERLIADGKVRPPRRPLHPLPPPPPPGDYLMTGDAIHLASASRVTGLIDELVTYDGRLAAAAVSAGFVVTSPSRLN